MKRNNKSEKVPEHMQTIFYSIAELTDKCCKERLNNDYALLARQAAAALCRKRPSPLVKGNIDAWACGILYALGFVNFLFDPSQTPHLTAEGLCEYFGISKSTGAAKARNVRESLGMRQMDPKWWRPGDMDKNPIAWYIEVDGFIVDARNMPYAIQEKAFELGLIPYIPGQKH